MNLITDMIFFSVGLIVGFITYKATRERELFSENNIDDPFTMGDFLKNTHERSITSTFSSFIRFKIISELNSDEFVHAIVGEDTIGLDTTNTLVISEMISAIVSDHSDPRHNKLIGFIEDRTDEEIEYAIRLAIEDRLSSDKEDSERFSTIVHINSLLKANDPPERPANSRIKVPEDRVKETSQTQDMLKYMDMDDSQSNLW